LSAPVAVHHRLEGPPDAPVLVLSHSLGCSLEMWDAQAPALAERYRVLRYDLRGHGRSPAPPGPYAIADLGGDLLALLDRLEVRSAHLCGVSLGAMVSLWLAARHPERVERLVACCTSAYVGPPEAWLERAALVRARGTGHIAEAVLARWFTPYLGLAHPERVASLRAALEATPAEGYAGCCEALAAMDLRPELGAVRAPTLAIAGDRDPATPLEHLAAIARMVSRGRVAIVEGAAHLANVEQPEQVTALILEHLGCPQEELEPGAAMKDPRWEDGMRVRREVLGDVHVDRAVARTTPFTAAFQDFITRTAWGDVWARPGLDRRTRSCITLAALTALGREAEIALHVRAALRNGVTADEIAEVLLHTAIYAGIPAAHAAFHVAARVLDEIAAEEKAQKG
jgi:3-oxoadipate enol-lactonase/4-carboxymuconolactone decarboxylase